MIFCGIPCSWCTYWLGVGNVYFFVFSVWMYWLLHTLWTLVQQWQIKISWFLYSIVLGSLSQLSDIRWVWKTLTSHMVIVLTARAPFLPRTTFTEAETLPVLCFVLLRKFPCNIQQGVPNPAFHTRQLALVLEKQERKERESISYNINLLLESIDCPVAITYITWFHYYRTIYHERRESCCRSYFRFREF